MSKYNWEKEKIEEAVKTSYNYRDVLRKLDIPIAGNNTATLKRKITEFNISITHFTFSASNLKTQTPVQDYLNKNTHITSFKLKEKLIAAGLKENKCEICGADIWLGKRLICQLHHINGDNTDNRLENLQILCPNCHSQTDNYCGQANSKENTRFCPDCGRPLKSKNSNYCPSCAAKKRKKVTLTKEELIKVLRETGNRNRAAKQLGVSEACIRKWCKEFNLPLKAKDLKKILQNTCFFQKVSIL